MSRYRLSTVRVSLVVSETARVKVDAPAVAVNVLRGIYAGLDADREHFTILALDAQLRIIGFKVVSTGSTSASIVDPKTLFRDALALGAVALILAHNHPSGDPAPSREDIAITRKLKAGGELLDMRVHDSIVLGDGDSFVSLAERGVL